MLKCIICDRDFDPKIENGIVIDDICDQCEEARNELTDGKGEE
jgi:hypothetical protein